MNCPSCGQEIPEGSKFCLHCGTAVSTDALPSTTDFIADALRRAQEGEGQVGVVNRPSDIAPIKSSAGKDLDVLQMALDAEPASVRLRAPNSALSATKSNTPVRWEEHEYVFTFPKGMWVRLAGSNTNGYTIHGAKTEFWGDWRNAILQDLQTWLDKGWEVVGPIDSDCIRVTTRTKSTMGRGGAILCIVLIPITVGLLSILMFIASFAEVAIPVDFRVTLRRSSELYDSAYAAVGALIAQRQWDLVVTAIDRCVALDPHNPKSLDLLNNKIVVLGAMLHRPQDALAACDQLIALDPKRADGWDLKILSLESLSRTDPKAQAQLEEVRRQRSIALEANGSNVEKQRHYEGL